MSKKKPKLVDTVITFKFTDPKLPDLGRSVFAQKIEALLEKARRLAEREAQGFHYEKVWINPTWVKRHQRQGHWSLRPVKRKRKQAIKGRKRS